MTETVYSVQEYVEDLKHITAEETDEKAIFKRLAPLAQKLAATPGWVTDTYRQCDEEQDFGNADESAKQSVEYAERSSQLLSEITQEMALIADMNNQVSTATDEQTTVANELSCNINEFSSSISLVSESSQQNAQASQELASLASRLQQQVHVFKV